MTYATQQDLIDRYGQKEIQQLSDRQNLGAIDATVVANALVDTDAQINAYLESKYTLPLATVPLVLKRIACDITRYQLYDTRATELVTSRYNDAISFLKSVAAGTATLGIDANNLPQTVSGGVNYSGNDRVFTRNNLSDFV